MVFYWEKLLNFLTGANLGLLTSAVKFFPRPKNFFHLNKGTWNRENDDPDDNSIELELLRQKQIMKKENRITSKTFVQIIFRPCARCQM